MSLNSVVVDQDYNIQSAEWENLTELNILENPDGTAANIGPNGGPYAWGEWYFDWETLNKGLFGERYNIEKDNETGVITDNLQFQLSDGTIIPHEITDHEKALIRLKVPLLNSGDNKIYMSYTDTPTEHTLALPAGVTEYKKQVTKMNKKYRISYNIN